MKNQIVSDPINHCLENDIDWALKNFDKMLKHLDTATNIDVFINDFKQNRLTELGRIYSLISEIRAGHYLVENGFPVTYIKEEAGRKTPDIKIVINNKNAYVEVKRISEREFEYQNLLDELTKRAPNCDIGLHLGEVIYSASDIADEIISMIQEDLPFEFGDDKRFDFGSVAFRKMKYKKPLYLPTTSYSIPQKKQEREKRNDAYISRQEVENGIIGDLDNSVEKFDEYADDGDLCFVFLDNIDVHNYGHEELKDFLYGGMDEIFLDRLGNVIKKNLNPIQESIGAQRLGWNKFLSDLGFFPPTINYSENRGWYLTSEDAKILNGVFHIISYDFSFSGVYCFLNPFVDENRNNPELENILKYYHK